MPAVLTENAITILKARYYAPGEDHDGLLDRVSLGEPRFRKLMADLDVLVNSPALMNAGTGNGCTSSACFKFDVSDTFLEDEDGIIGTRAKAAAVAKAGGGVGYYLGNVRQKGALIRSIHRKACGPVAVLKDYQGLRALVTQGGKRDLAQMGILPYWHPDIREFIHVKDEDPEALNSFNISVSWTDDGMREAERGGTPEAALWAEQIESAWRTGDPGVYYFSAAERGNPSPHLGQLTGTNPCGEVPLTGGEACNLSSINLGNFVARSSREIDWQRLDEVAYQATLFLDLILDQNVFPHPSIDRATRLTRKLGLGVMGYADMLAILGMHYDTEEAVLLGERVMQCIDASALRASIDLAKKHGPYPGYRADRATSDPVRNATRTCIAPTGTISIIAGCSSGIEPHYLLEWDRKTNEGIVLHERVPVWNDLDGFVPKTANEIGWEWHVRHQAAFQKHTNLAVSKTVNVPNSATREDVSNAYRTMWKMGCKGGTVFRDGCRGEQVLVARGKHKKTASVYATVESVPAPAMSVVAAVRKRRKLPNDRQSLTHKFQIGQFEGYVTVGLYEDDTPGELFFKVSKEGSTISGLMDSWAMSVSLALQYGCPLSTLVRLHSGMRFEPAGLTRNEAMPVCASIADYVFRWLGARFPEKDKEEKIKSPAAISLLASKEMKSGVGVGAAESGLFCPECHAEAVYANGCLSCPDRACGWTRCG